MGTTQPVLSERVQALVSKAVELFVGSIPGSNTTIAIEAKNELEARRNLSLEAAELRRDYEARMTQFQEQCRNVPRGKWPNEPLRGGLHNLEQWEAGGAVLESETVAKLQALLEIRATIDAEIIALQERVRAMGLT